MSGEELVKPQLDDFIAQLTAQLGGGGGRPLPDDKQRFVDDVDKLIRQEGTLRTQIVDFENRKGILTLSPPGKEKKSQEGGYNEDDRTHIPSITLPSFEALSDNKPRAVITMTGEGFVAAPYTPSPAENFIGGLAHELGHMKHPAVIDGSIGSVSKGFSVGRGLVSEGYAVDNNVTIAQEYTGGLTALPDPQNPRKKPLNSARHIPVEVGDLPGAAADFLNGERNKTDIQRQQDYANYLVKKQSSETTSDGKPQDYLTMYLNKQKGPQDPALNVGSVDNASLTIGADGDLANITFLMKNGGYKVYDLASGSRTDFSLQGGKEVRIGAIYEYPIDGTGQHPGSIIEDVLGKMKGYLQHDGQGLAVCESPPQQNTPGHPETCVQIKR